MAVKNGVLSKATVAEQTPLLQENQGKRSNGPGAALSQPLADAEDEEDLIDSTKANQHVGKARGGLIVLSLWGLIFLQAANFSGVTIAQSRIAEDLDAFAQVTWFSSAYLISLSSFSPIAARLAQVFSPRSCMFLAAIFFSLGGLITSQAPSIELFLLGRVVSGLGAAGIMTISFILVLELSGKKRRGLFIGLVNTGFTAGVSLGALIVGALLPTMGWRFLFWIQTPIGVLAGLGLFLSIPGSFTSGHKSDTTASVWSKLAKIDYLGGITLIVALACFLFGLSWPKILWPPIVASAFLTVFFVLIEIYVASDPIIPVAVLKSRGTLCSCFAQLGIMASRWMVLFYSPTWAMGVRGWDHASAGSVLIPTNLGFAVGGLTVGALHINRAGSFWLPSIISTTCFTGSLLLISQLSSPNITAVYFLLAIFANGLCAGATITYALAHLLHITPPSSHFISSALLNTFRGFAGSFGSAVGGGIFLRTLSSRLTQGFEEHGGLKGRAELIRRLVGAPALVPGLSGVEREVAISSYSTATGILFLSGAIVAGLMVFVQAGTGWTSVAEVDKPLLEEEWEEG
ncbi:major facilitator superfamily domain-containing protein [Calycina marina]|uniref:Major facilitator superfamily domain-containing protein n=1 Tax=Calycina marina TaxID=1763456 RepID=A0A9P7YV27_9HELO|nr:major facilitator superfamily domain-containing protein [Calycina marina]